MTGIEFKITKQTVSFLADKFKTGFTHYNFTNEFMIEVIGLGHKCFVASNTCKYPYMPSKKGMKQLIEEFNKMEYEEFSKCFYFVVPMTLEEMKNFDYSTYVKSL